MASSPRHYAEQAMSPDHSTTCRPSKGFWHCDDLALGRELGLYPDEDVSRPCMLIATRPRSSGSLYSLHAHGVISGNISQDVNWVGMTPNSTTVCNCMSAAAVPVQHQLEDWLEMDKPVNVYQLRIPQLASQALPGSGGYLRRGRSSAGRQMSGPVMKPAVEP